MVGSDKERPKGRVGSGSDNARGSPILTQNIYISKAKCFVLLVEYKYSFFGVLYFKKHNEL